jgi:hypothetical protein
MATDLDALNLDADDTRIPQSRSIGLLLPVRRGQCASDQPFSTNPVHRRSVRESAQNLEMTTIAVPITDTED